MKFLEKMSREQWSWLLDRFNEGYKMEDIADWMGISSRTVVRYWEKWGLRYRPRQGLQPLEERREEFDLLQRSSKNTGNAPLTTQYLRELPLREWVWIEVLKPFDHREKTSGYYRKCYDYNDEQGFPCGYPGISFFFEYEEYGDTWVAYRHKPEEGAQ